MIGDRVTPISAGVDLPQFMAAAPAFHLAADPSLHGFPANPPFRHGGRIRWKPENITGVFSRGKASGVLPLALPLAGLFWPFRPDYGSVAILATPFLCHGHLPMEPAARRASQRLRGF
jgi:hypothetical protein